MALSLRYLNIDATRPASVLSLCSFSTGKDGNMTAISIETVKMTTMSSKSVNPLTATMPCRDICLGEKILFLNDMGKSRLLSDIRMLQASLHVPALYICILAFPAFLAVRGMADNIKIPMDAGA